MWVFWLTVIVFWFLVYCFSSSRQKRDLPEQHDADLPTTTPPKKRNLKKTAFKHRPTTAERDSDAEERSSVSSVSDDESFVSATQDIVQQQHVSPRHETIRTGVGQLVVESDRFNSLFYRVAAGGGLATSRRNRWRKFFAVGQQISVIFIIPSTILLILMLFSMSCDVFNHLPSSNRYYFSTAEKNSVEAVTLSAALAQFSTTTDRSVTRRDEDFRPSTSRPLLVAEPVIAIPKEDYDNYSNKLIVVNFAPDYVQNTSTRREHDVQTGGNFPYASGSRYSTDYRTGWIPHMKLLLPGLNVNASHLFTLLSAVLICTLVHEAGHAIAAVVEGISLDSVGFAFVVCFPIAFVKVDIDNVDDADDVAPNDASDTKKMNSSRSTNTNTSKTIKKLRVLCAGVWCNAIFSALCLIAAFCLSLIMLSISSYDMANSSSISSSDFSSASSFWSLHRDGVVVSNISAGSAAASNLVPGDRITAINGCRVRSLDDLHRCLAVEPFGFCLRDDELRQIKVKVSGGTITHPKPLNPSAAAGEHQHHNCCGNSPAALAAGLCFSRAEVFNLSFSEVQCVNIRRLLQFRLDQSMCYNSSNECGAGVAGALNNNNKFCYMPVLDTNERLFIIDKHAAATTASSTTDIEVDADDDEAEKIVIIGAVSDVLSATFMPSFRNVSVRRGGARAARAVVASGCLATVVEYAYAACLYAQSFLNTCAGVSIAIYLLNIVPCLYLDGDKLVRILIMDKMLAGFHRRFASLIASAVVCGGTLLVCAVVALAFSRSLLDFWTQ